MSEETQLPKQLFVIFAPFKPVEKVEISREALEAIAGEELKLITDFDEFFLKVNGFPMNEFQRNRVSGSFYRKKKAARQNGYTLLGATLAYYHALVLGHNVFVYVGANNKVTLDKYKALFNSNRSLVTASMSNRVELKNGGKLIISEASEYGNQVRGHSLGLSVIDSHYIDVGSYVDLKTDLLPSISCQSGKSHRGFLTPYSDSFYRKP